MTPWTVACQVPVSMGFSRQEEWSALSFPSPGGLPIPRIKPVSLVLQVDSLSSELPVKPGRRIILWYLGFPHEEESG